MSRNDSGFYGVVYDDEKDRFESYVVLYESEKKRLPPHLSSRVAFSGGYYRSVTCEINTISMISRLITCIGSPSGSHASLYV